MTIYRNISEDGKEETYERLFCSQELTTGIHIYLIFLSVFNFLLAICSSLGKILILIALHKGTCLHALSKLFLRSLATTDLLVGVISEPLPSRTGFQRSGNDGMNVITSFLSVSLRGISSVACHC